MERGLGKEIVGRGTVSLGGSQSESMIRTLNLPKTTQPHLDTQPVLDMTSQGDRGSDVCLRCDNSKNAKTLEGKKKSASLKWFNTIIIAILPVLKDFNYWNTDIPNQPSWLLWRSACVRTKPKQQSE